MAKTSATKAPKKSAKGATKVENAGDIATLIKQLTKVNAEGDRGMGKKIRRKLRALGHRGGLRGQGANVAE